MKAHSSSRWAQLLVTIWPYRHCFLSTNREIVCHCPLLVMLLDTIPVNCEISWWGFMGSHQVQALELLSTLTLLVIASWKNFFLSPHLYLCPFLFLSTVFFLVLTPYRSLEIQSKPCLSKDISTTHSSSTKPVSKNCNEGPGFPLFWGGGERKRIDLCGCKQFQL